MHVCNGTSACHRDMVLRIAPKYMSHYGMVPSHMYQCTSYYCMIYINCNEHNIAWYRGAYGTNACHVIWHGIRTNACLTMA